MDIVVEAVLEYLQDNRRLVVPSFGAFMVKASGERLFSDLLSADDGVLASLLRDKGLSEMEVAVSIDRFVFEVRHELNEYGYCRLGELGTLRIEPETKVLRLYPPVQGEELPQQAPYVPEPISEPGGDDAVAEPAIDDVEPAIIPVLPGIEPEVEPAVEPEPAPAVEPTVEPEPAPAVEPLAVEKGDAENSVIDDKIKELAIPSVTSSRGLLSLYDEPEKVEAPSEVTTDEKDIDKAEIEPSTAPVPSVEKKTNLKKRRRVDLIIVLAILTVLVALTALAYGWYASRLNYDDRAADDAEMAARRETMNK